jgi:hypothetical protein
MLYQAGVGAQHFMGLFLPQKSRLPAVLELFYQLYWFAGHVNLDICGNAGRGRCLEVWKLMS